MEARGEIVDSDFYKRQINNNRVIEVMPNNKCKILYAGTSYVARCDTQVSVDDIVWVCAPQNNWSELNVQLSYRPLYELFYSLNNSLSKYLPITGGTVSGSTRFNNELVTKMGHWVHSANGINGTSGYVSICRITISGSYCNQSFRIKVFQRNRDGGEISIRFNNLNGIDPTLASFKVYQDLEPVQMVKVAPCIWDLYIHKSEAYDTIDVVDVQKGPYMSQLAIDWTNGFSTSSPDGTVATVIS
jgi:hypothetical protein